MHVSMREKVRSATLYTLWLCSMFPLAQHFAAPHHSHALPQPQICSGYLVCLRGLEIKISADTFVFSRASAWRFHENQVDARTHWPEAHAAWHAILREPGPEQ